MTISAQAHPVLLIIRGIPGSGKTHLTASIQRLLGDFVTVLDPDAIDRTSKEYSDFSQKLTAEAVDAKFHLYRYSRAKAYNAIENHQIIIWNQPFMDFDGLQKTIANLQNYATEHGTHLPVLIIEVEVDANLAKQRINERKSTGGHGPSDETFYTRFIDKYESFAGRNYPTLTINGTNDIEDSARTVIDAVQQLA